MKIKLLVAVVALIGTGAVAGFFVARAYDYALLKKKNEASKQVRQGGNGYIYINPLLECDVAQGTLNATKINFDAKLEQYAKNLKQQHGLTELAVYFRDLNNGPTFGVDEQGEFFPASLLKVPVMMAYYRWSETEPGLLSIPIVYESPVDFGVTPTILPKEQLILGQTYTVEELLERMIVYSDNQALALLSTRLPLEKMTDLFSMLGVRDEVLTNQSAKLSVKEYASFFRILFNSSYLSTENSEKALALLARTDFSDALPAGIPNRTPIAHKFGEAGATNEERQLHDCGIVYYPDHPYLACIMTRGFEASVLRTTIADTSRFIYQQVEAQYTRGR